MRTFVSLLVIVFLSACMATAPGRPLLAPKSVYGQIGATMNSPGEEGWSLVQANNVSVAFGRRYGTADETAIANTIIFRVDGFENDKEFLDYIAGQREKQDDKKRFKIVTITNEQVRFKDTACLRYSGLSEDHRSKGIDSADFQYLKTAGYVCRHPANKAAAFQMEISHRSQKKAFPRELTTVGEDFFNNVRFTEAGLK